MKICIVTRPAQFAAAVGACVRYDRIARIAQQMGVCITRVPMDQFAASEFEHDLYVFADAYSVETLLLAYRIRQSGRLVAIDVSTGCFSQRYEARLEYARGWLSAMDEHVHFYLCSTPLQVATIRGLVKKEANIFLAPDPAPLFNPHRLSHLLQSKVQKVLDSRNITLLWFDGGENLESSDGIRDLVGYGSELKTLMRDGWTAELTILIDTRSRASNYLSCLRQLPVPISVREWSHESEKLEIERHFACYLPANFHRFGREGGLTRAVSALVGGDQVIGPGFPLYRDLGNFILDGPAALLSRLIDGRLPLRFDTVSILTEKLAKVANLFQAVEAMQLGIETARSIKPRRFSHHSPREPDERMSAARESRPRYDVGIIYGRTSNGAKNNTASAFGGLSVKSPLCRDKLDFDVRIDLDCGQLMVLVDERIVELIPVGFRKLATSRRILQTSYARLVARPFHSCFGNFAYWHLSNRATEVAASASLLRGTQSVCRLLFPETRFYISEHHPLFATRDWAQS